MRLATFEYEISSCAGASSGIGESCALYLASQGWRVFATVRKQEQADRLKQVTPDNLYAVLLEITDQSSVRQLAKAILRELGDGTLDGLVNNAGIVLSNAVEILDISDLRRQLEVNFFGHVSVIKAFLLLLRKSGGRIVNISSTSGRIALPFLSPYAASKFALEAMSDTLRVELRPWGIYVSIIEPGSITTPIWDKSIQAAHERIRDLPPEALELYRAVIYRVQQAASEIGRSGLPPLEVSRAVEHALVSRHPKARYVIGKGTRWVLLAERIAPVWLRDWFIARQLRIE